MTQRLRRSCWLLVVGDCPSGYAFDFCGVFVLWGERFLRRLGGFGSGIRGRVVPGLFAVAGRRGVVSGMYWGWCDFELGCGVLFWRCFGGWAFMGLAGGVFRCRANGRRDHDGRFGGVAFCGCVRRVFSGGVEGGVRLLGACGGWRDNSCVLLRFPRGGL